MGWILPGMALALMPKCPACFAAYFAAATGLGLTYSVASQLRTFSIAVCTTILIAMCLGFMAFIRKHFKSIKNGSDPTR